MFQLQLANCDAGIDDIAATLEAAFGVCLGCVAYSAIWGCADCDDIGDRLRRAMVEAREEATAGVS